MNWSSCTAWRALTRSFPSPTYSEIGILFCRADQEAQPRIPCIRSKAGAAAAQRAASHGASASPACIYEGGAAARVVYRRL